jgi:hypothetical protein
VRTANPAFKLERMRQLTVTLYTVYSIRFFWESLAHGRGSNGGMAAENVAVRGNTVFKVILPGSTSSKLKDEECTVLEGWLIRRELLAQ